MLDRRGFLAGLGALALAGCARQAPILASPSATPTPTAKTEFTVVSGTTPIELAVRGLLVAALTSQTTQGVGQDVSSDDANGNLLDLAELPSGLLVGFARTMINGLSPSKEVADADVLSELAALVEPGASVLDKTPVDGRLVWAAPKASKLTSLAQLKDKCHPAKKKTVSLKAGIPAFAAARGDGVPALTVVYNAVLDTTYIPSPTQRREALDDGRVELAAFRACDFAALDGLVQLKDPSGIAQADPMVVLPNAALPDAQPNAVLSVLAALGKMDADNLLALEASAASGQDLASAAVKWLAGEGLG
ncbi:MAG: hypothetical protein LBR32_03980 [Propionibacteriaceae bacterium]|jgi:hypothetical protein|nr:hypothetical protein [Propionibacteriaceae bacterium]